MMARNPDPLGWEKARARVLAAEKPGTHHQSRLDSYEYAHGSYDPGQSSPGRISNEVYQLQDTPTRDVTGETDARAVSLRNGAYHVQPIATD